MAMSASNPSVLTGRIEELEQENARLREQLRGFAAQQTVVRGALTEAVQEKEAAARLAHQVTVEERATRAAVESAGSNISFAVILQIINFFLLLALLFTVLVWLPPEVSRRTVGRTVVAPGNGVVIGR